METVSLAMPDGGVLDFEVRDDPALPILFALGVRKSGSSLFNLVVIDLARANGWPVVLLPDAAFAAGYRMPDWNRNPGLPGVLRPGNVYGGFRDAPSGLYDVPAFRAARKILLVRDPRDALVSEYFSSAYSHSLPERNAETSLVAQRRAEALAQSVEDYVLAQAKQLNRTIDAYAPLLADPQLTLFRYEEVIFDKARWIGEIAAIYGWQAPPDLVQAILARHDLHPEVEEPTAFVRHVAPGDHREKLAPSAIARLGEILSPTWAMLGYDLR